MKLGIEIGCRKLGAGFHIEMYFYFLQCTAIIPVFQAFEPL